MKVRCKSGFNLFGLKPGFSYRVCGNDLPEYLLHYFRRDYPNDLDDTWEDPPGEELCDVAEVNAAYAMCTIDFIQAAYGSDSEIYRLLLGLNRLEYFPDALCSNIRFCKNTGEVLVSNIGEVGCLDCTNIAGEWAEDEEKEITCLDLVTGERYIVYLSKQSVLCDQGPGIVDPSENENLTKYVVQNDLEAKREYIENLPSTDSKRYDTYGFKTLDTLIDNSSVDVFPNPTKGLIFIKWNKLNLSDYEKDAALKIRVLNILGVEVLKPIEMSSEIISLDLGALSSGFYIVELSCNGLVLDNKRIYLNR